MTLAEFFHTLLIQPLELVFETIYMLVFHNVISNYGLSIIALSFTMNLLLLPLYKRTDAIQEEAAATEKRLKPYVTHIRKTFKGDERFMMLQTCYRQNHYKPTDSLKGISPLLLEIPFFMAAYRFLSGLEALNGVSFGPIRDLGAPDGMLVIGSLAINVLPLLMTLINLVSCAIYAKDMPVRTKVQMYGMAAVFLVLLYSSPSGLVFYWTLNNVFSLVKNIIQKSRRPLRTLCIGSSVVGLGFLAIGVLGLVGSTHTRVVAILLFVLCELPSLMAWLRPRIHLRRSPLLDLQLPKGMFFLGCGLLTLVLGLLIPSALIDASAQEFLSAQSMSSPLLYVLHNAVLFGGLFLVWAGIFYMLATPACRKVMSFFVWILSGMAIVNYMFFGKDYGMISPRLQFDIAPVITLSQVLLNLAVLAAVILVFRILWLKKARLVQGIYLTLCIAVAGMSILNMTQIHRETADLLDQDWEGDSDIVLPLSATEKNVVVIMLDRGISAYVPYLFTEMPELQKEFYGFTYYPNTVSHGPSTNFGAPGLYGGYEYTPLEMNRRDQILLPEKHDEALKVMPVLFDREGYQVTVCDPTLAGYGNFTDLHIYDDYPDIRAYHMMGAFSDLSPQELEQEFFTTEKKFAAYSLFKTAPVLLQPTVYDGGNYNQARVKNIQVCTSGSTATGYNKHFMESYKALAALPELTEITSNGSGSFIMMSNDTAHEPTMLQRPGYEPMESVNNVDYDADPAHRPALNGTPMPRETLDQTTHYHANAATYLQLGKWFRYLQDQGCYDNTRIILVADHGRDLGQFPELMVTEDRSVDAMFYNPVLLVKDFDSQTMTMDTRFMTNADVPSLAMEDVIREPVNPFTGKPIDQSYKDAGCQYIIASTDWQTQNNCGYRFNPSQWYRMENDVFDPDGWTLIQEQDLSLSH